MGTVHVVATPIGNLEDITLRALRVLSEVDLILAEDTRRTRVLLDRYEIRTRTLSLNAHNEAARLETALELLQGGGAVALVSDAGTPLVSDPGERLVARVVEAGHRVEALPGASAVLAALSVSGLPASPFCFQGFPPRRGGPLRRWLEALRERPETLVFFEAPHRVAKTLAAMAEVLGPRRACVARELTKLHEELARGTLPELAQRFAEGARGEFTLVVEGASGTRPAMSEDELAAEIRARLSAGEGAREIAAALSEATPFSRNEVYARVVAAREKS